MQLCGHQTAFPPPETALNELLVPLICMVVTRGPSSGEAPAGAQCSPGVPFRTHPAPIGSNARTGMARKPRDTPALPPVRNLNQDSLDLSRHRPEGAPAAACGALNRHSNLEFSQPAEGTGLAPHSAKPGVRRGSVTSTTVFPDRDRPYQSPRKRQAFRSCQRSLSRPEM
jgi:hypothetical protein